MTAPLLFVLVCTCLAAQETPTLLVLRPIPKVKSQRNDLAIAPIVKSDVSEIKIGGKPATITAWTSLLNGPTTLQLVVLLDYQQRIGVGHQFDDIKNLFNSLPSNVEIAVGYLLQGKAKIAQPLTTDRTLAANALRLPTRDEAANPQNQDGSPYYCLQDLAVHWPDPDPKKVRAVLVFTDGTPRYNNSGGANLQVNPEVDMASQSLLRAGIQAFPVFYLSPEIPIGPEKRGGVGGQNKLDQLAEATNGQALYNPQITTATFPFSPLLYRFYSILYSEAVVTVAAKGSGLKSLDIKPSRDDLKVVGPQEVMIGNELPRK
jgi:hypothetical protein